ncbi:MAG TPA: hypothetical protein VGJ56_00770 [Reyranella sp.]|jgi:hypothetical protein
MDETQTGWYRWTARNADHLPALLFGIALGGLLAVFFNAVNPQGRTLPAYLGVLPGLIGWALGVASARRADTIADRRKVRRKMHLNIMLLRNILEPWKRAIDLGAEWDRLMEVDHRFGKEATELSKANDGLIRLAPTLKAHLIKPNFEDIIDSTDDAKHAYVVNEAFRTATIATEGSDIPFHSAALQPPWFQRFRDWACDPATKKALADLEAAETHFRQLTQ